MAGWATNLQDEDFEPEMEEVFERSTIDWLSDQDLRAIYHRHNNNPFPLSLLLLGPEPHEEGLFLYRSRRFSDRFHWNDVHQPRRLNCISGRTIPGQMVTHTQASLQLPNGDTFLRRNHHLGTHPICIVHYLIRPADDGGADAGGDDDGGADAGGDEDGGSDAGGDDDGGGEEPAGEEEDEEEDAEEDDPKIDESAGVKTDIMVRLGASSWETNRGEEFRVGAGVAEPYPLIWCAVEFFETSGEILRLLLKLQSPNAPHNGRTLLHHAVLCGNQAAIRVLLSCGADPETPIRTSQPYYEVGKRYNDGKISELEAVVVAHSSDFEKDNNLGLLKQAVSSLYKRNILRLTQKYLTWSLQDIANVVQLANAKEAGMHVLQMIQDGQIHALINQKDGMVRFLEDSEQYKTSEMIEVMDSVIQSGMICNALHYNVVTAPMYQVNAIAPEAYKKYILVNLIHSGQFSSNFPKCASSAALRHLEN